MIRPSYLRALCALLLLVGGLVLWRITYVECRSHGFSTLYCLSH